MEIFPAEIDANLSDILSAKSSICYAALLEPSTTATNTKISNIKALAGIEDKDLYYTQSILVTTSWNKNDDIFDKAEVWAAKDTPTHKPTNLEHQENTIVGHITSNWPMTEDGILIDESTPAQNLPDKFHILTGSVIYVGYTDPDLRSRAEKLIAEIEQGTKYVSMECFFKGFDYGLVNKSTGEYKILGRNAETAFLTKHLRAYGGLGEHQDYKIGRVLRNITFSGKGFVDKPANPESIIFTKDSLKFDKKIATIEINKEKNSTFENMGVFSNQANLKENDMNLEQQVAEINTKLEAMSKCAETVAEAKSLASSLTEQNKALETTLKANEAEIVEIKTALENANIEKEEAAKKMSEEMMKKEEEMKKVKSELDAALEALAAYKGKEAEMMKKEKKMKRMAALVETGIDTELANATVEKFEALDDETFDGMKEVFAAMMPKMMKKKMAKAEEVAETSSTDISETLENAEPEKEIDLSVGTETEVPEIDSTRAALVDFVYNRLGKKLNKGE